MSGITPCTWQLSCSPRAVSRVSAPGMGEAQEASTSRKAGCCSPPARLPGSCHRCAAPPLSSFGDKHKWSGRALLLPSRVYSPSRREKIWAVARGRRPECSHHPVWVLLLSLAPYSPLEVSLSCSKLCFCQRQKLAICLYTVTASEEEVLRGMILFILTGPKSTITVDPFIQQPRNSYSFDSKPL